MRVAVELKGPLAVSRGEKHIILVVPPRATVRDVLIKLGLDEKHVGLLAINNVKVNLDSCLGEDVNLTVFPVVAGG
ncbi:MAG: hypothetical protein VR67_11275 [Peptococcaceae bacterium BRH_c8a]|nr:MAG: hypothetical protein VR67_11275 [Peptococcaceae bacterium BRH_c8a]